MADEEDECVADEIHQSETDDYEESQSMSDEEGMIVSKVAFSPDSSDDEITKNYYYNIC